jgi:hypothetical protein
VEHGILKDQSRTKEKRAGKMPALRKKMTKTIHVDGRPVWAEVSLKAILRNLAIIRKHINSTPYGKHSTHGDHSHERIILAAESWDGMVWSDVRE